MKDYEIVYIFDSALEDDAINERLDRFHGLLVEACGNRALQRAIAINENDAWAWFNACRCIS